MTAPEVAAHLSAEDASAPNLVRYDAACRAIQAAATVDEAKDIKDQATALAAYARQRNNPDLEIQAAEIRARARRRIGEISAGLGKGKPAGQGRGRPTLPDAGKYKAQVLEEAGISTSEADRCEDIASIPEEEVEALFAECREKGKPVSSDELLRKVQRKHKRKVHRANLKEQPWPEGKYRVLYADPPWRYEHSVSDSRDIENQYPTMDLENICALQVDGLCAEDCVLFMWATMPKLAEALSVIQAWGFDYRTGAVWDKELIGMGYYFRQQHELLLVATRGTPGTPEDSARVPSVIRSRRGQHSEKPEAFRDLIDRMYPHGPRIELFARQRHEGWDVWGNEVDGDP